MKYAVVIERGPTSYGATVPHVAFLRDEGQPIPESVTRIEYIDVVA